jgi:hypothetical protein
MYLSIAVNIIRPSNNIDIYYICCCFIPTAFIVVMNNLVYRLLNPISDDEIYIFIVHNILIWSTVSLIAFLFSFFDQPVYNYINNFFL